LTSEAVEADIERAETGRRLHDLARVLQPLPRSITGNGVRETLRILGEDLDLELVEIPSGTAAFDWTIPDEWNLGEAWIRDPGGRTIVDVRDSTLHVVGYSTPIHGTLPLEELSAHLHSDPGRPDWIPYRTSYYTRHWGFCLPHRLRESLVDGDYEVFIDATLEPGSLTYGELLLPGTEPAEVLISAHCCHPWMCNDNLSGLVVAAELGRRLRAADHRLSYRILFAPGTIGALAWLAANGSSLDNLHAGLVLTCLGDPGPPTYKRSRRGDTLVDRASSHVLQHRTPPGSTRRFSPTGYDERQYCSPGFNLPVGCLMRTPWGEFPQYHSSADDLDFVTPDALADSLEVCLEIIAILESNATALNLSPFGEPQLGRRGLYASLGGLSEKRDVEQAQLWVLNLGDGVRDLLGIAEASGLPFGAVRLAADRLRDAGLLELS
jgi:aminopeptidase-like protein